MGYKRSSGGGSADTLPQDVPAAMLKKGAAWIAERS
jgi:hypothetical protein